MGDIKVAELSSWFVCFGEGWCGGVQKFLIEITRIS